MEMALERILESLLVGALGSLLLLGFIFVFFGHRFRIPLIRRLFKFLLYEEHLTEQHPVDDTPRAYQLFITALLVAALYGFGLVTEAVSDGFTSSRIMTWWADAGYWFGTDPTIKIKAFESVGKSVVTMGGASKKFSQFVTDYRACDNTSVARKRNDRWVETGPCQELLSRGKTFYYSAKNVVAREETYAKELGDLQRRINFTRSMSQTLSLIFVELTLMALLGAVAEHFYQGIARTDNGDSRARPQKLWLELLAHWRDFAAARCLLLGLGALLMAIISMFSWYYEEDQFDRRVFGYFLSYGLELDETDQDGEPDERTGEEADESRNSRRGIYAWAIPRSPYEVFGFGGGHFEPSGVTRIGERSYGALVVNDKDLMQPFVLFDLSKSNSLKKGRRLKLPESTLYGKMESVQAIKRNGETVVYASPTFGPKPRRIIRFVLPADVLTTPEPAIGKVDDLPLAVDDLCTVLFDVAPAPEGGCVVEGIALPNPAREEEILLGVRRKQHKDGEMRPVMAMIRLILKDARYVPEKVFELTLPAVDNFACAPFSGISDLDVTDKGDLLVLTSIELQKPRGGTQTDAKAKDENPEEQERREQQQECRKTLKGKSTEEHSELEPVQEVQGALWKFPAGTNLSALRAEEWHNYRVARFAHKPEGVTMLDDGAALVVFDDDGDRKSRAAAPGSFALDHEESVFTVVRGVARR